MPAPPAPGAVRGARPRDDDGRRTRRLAFPDLVAVEQPIAGFDDIATLAVEIGTDLWLEAALDGDVFQAEDQRAWIDASTKIYGTPVTRPKPVTVPRGTRIAQRITLRLRTERGDVARITTTPFVVDCADGALRLRDGRGRLPAIGVRTAGPVRHANPPHLRVDWISPATRRRRRSGRTVARPQVRQPALELALHLPDDAAAAARALTCLDLDGLESRACSPSPSATNDPARHARGRVRLARAAAAHASFPIATGTASDLDAIHLAPRSRPPTRCAGRWIRRRTPPT